MNKSPILSALVIITLIGFAGCRNEDQQGSTSSVKEAQASLTGSYQIEAVSQGGRISLGTIDKSDLGEVRNLLARLAAKKTESLDAIGGRIPSDQIQPVANPGVIGKLPPKVITGDCPDPCVGGTVPREDK